MSEIEQYDAIVIGAGQAGGPLSTALARAGLRTVLIERAHVGGTCINTGCTPTKTMIASARVAYLAQRATEYGVQTGDVQVNLEKVRERKRDMVERFRRGSQRYITGSAGLDLLMGEASFEGAYAIKVRYDGGEGRHLTARHIFINTGTRPARPPLEGLDQVPALDSTSIMELDEIPRHLLVLGGGYVGLEFGQMFQRFGSQVTIVQRATQLLASEDADVATAVAEVLLQDGIQVLLEAQAVRVAAHDEGIRLTLQTPGGMRQIDGSHLLVATGRIPNTDMLNLPSAGIEADRRGYIKVNERLETTVPGIYAMGDVTGGPAFTHISYDDFRILRTNVIEGGQATTSGRLVPYTVFLDPQLGRVGLSENEARAQGRAIRVARLPMSHIARALEVAETRGFMKAIVDANTGQILGCAIFGLEGGELMSMLQVAMMGRLPYSVLRDAIFAHPTLAESLNNLFMTLD